MFVAFHASPRRYLLQNRQPLIRRVVPFARFISLILLLARVIFIDANEMCPDGKLLKSDPSGRERFDLFLIVSVDAAVSLEGTD